MADQIKGVLLYIVFLPIKSEAVVICCYILSLTASEEEKCLVVCPLGTVRDATESAR